MEPFRERNNARRLRSSRSRRATCSLSTSLRLSPTRRLQPCEYTAKLLAGPGYASLGRQRERELEVNHCPILTLKLSFALPRA